MVKIVTIKAHKAPKPKPKNPGSNSLGYELREAMRKAGPIGSKNARRKARRYGKDILTAPDEQAAIQLHNKWIRGKLK